ncbi:hypothetical protein [Stenomitos frigidus]|nr:hypothetical protein [Stenomitos frigidus]
MFEKPRSIGDFSRSDTGTNQFQRCDRRSRLQSCRPNLCIGSK